MEKVTSVKRIVVSLWSTSECVPRWLDAALISKKVLAKCVIMYNNTFCWPRCARGTVLHLIPLSSSLRALKHPTIEFCLSVVLIFHPFIAYCSHFNDFRVNYFCMRYQLLRALTVLLVCVLSIRLEFSLAFDRQTFGNFWGAFFGDDTEQQWQQVNLQVVAIVFLLKGAVEYWKHLFRCWKLT